MSRETGGSSRHDPGYAHVSIRGVEFTLNAVQAGIVRVLHRAALDGRRWVSGEELRQETGFRQPKLSGVFRYLRNPSWREIIASDGRGSYRLNV
jgi:predicted transcriptional regulator